YGDPALLILDEPNANLDAQGEQALVDAIRDAKARGRTVIIMAHRPSAIAACDHLLMIDRGAQVEFGPRDEVLKKRTRNYPQLVARQQAPAAAEPAGTQAGQVARQAAPQAVGEQKSPGTLSPTRTTVALTGE
ncbi:MAG TPA: hypothetical protein VFJ13_07130, partial [Paracoccaceae bacterium]|nr:hypothetical protein [Paracoccaceae bacterium]